MAFRNLFSIDPALFISTLKSIEPDFLSLKTAEALDAVDPLGFTANLFDTGSLVSLAGHSLGYNLADTEKNISKELKLQKDHLHAGHFQHSHPDGKNSGHWFDRDMHTLSLQGAQQLLGFKKSQEFCFIASGLSANLGTLAVTFFDITPEDWIKNKTKIVVLEKEFFSDQAILVSAMKKAIAYARRANFFNKDSKYYVGRSEPAPEQEIIKIPADENGLYSEERIIEIIQTNADKIQLICLSDIVFNTGQRLQFDKIFAATEKLIKANKIRVFLDLAHTVGNRAINLSSMPAVTAAFSCAYKHLSAPAGSPFGMYVSESADLKSYPPIQGWKTADPSRVFGKINTYDESIMSQEKGAVAFRTSNPAVLSLIPVQTYLTEMGIIGFDKLFKKSERLTVYLIEQLKYHLGDSIEFVTPLDPKKRGATICLKLKKDIDLELLEKKLSESGFAIDTRPPNIIRITAHYGHTKFSHICQFVLQFKLALNKKAEATFADFTAGKCSNTGMFAESVGRKNEVGVTAEPGFKLGLRSHV